MPSTGAAPRKRNISSLKRSPLSKRRSAIPIPNGRKLIHQSSQNKTLKFTGKLIRKHTLFMRSEIEAMAQDDIQMPFDMQEKNKVPDTQSLFSAPVDFQSEQSLPDTDSNQISDF